MTTTVNPPWVKPSGVNTGGSVGGATPNTVFIADGGGLLQSGPAIDDFAQVDANGNPQLTGVGDDVLVATGAGGLIAAGPSAAASAAAASLSPHISGGILGAAGLPTAIAGLGATVALHTLAGVDPTGAGDSTTPVLAAIAAAQNAGPNGTNLICWITPGTTLRLSEPIPLYAGLTIVALGTISQMIEHPNATIINTHTDIFTTPGAATTGTMTDVHITGLNFVGNSLAQNTSVVTPQATNATGWIFEDFYFCGNTWEFFRSCLVGSFLRLHLKGFSGNNCSSRQLVLYGADSEVGIDRSYIDSFLVGNQARWPTVTAAETGAWVQNNIVQIADTNGNLHFFRANATTAAAPAAAVPYSQGAWTYIGTYFSAAPGSTAYSAGTVYNTIGTLVTFGGQTYYNATVQTTAGNPPPGASQGQHTNNAQWLWVDGCYGTSSAGASPQYHIEFGLAVSELYNVYPTCCPCSGIYVTEQATGSSVHGNPVNGYAPGREDNSGNQLPGSDGEGIYIYYLIGSSTTPEPAGLLSVYDNYIVNYGQDPFAVHNNGINIQDSSHVRCWGNKFSCESWTDGPTVNGSVIPYRIGQASATTGDIKIRDTTYSGSGSVSAYVTLSGTITKLETDTPAGITYTAGANTIPIWAPTTYVTGGTISLPSAASVYTHLRFFVANATSGALTLSSASGNINGTSTLNIAANSAVEIASDGTEWWAT